MKRPLIILTGALILSGFGFFVWTVKSSVDEKFAIIDNELNALNTSDTTGQVSGTQSFIEPVNGGVNPYLIIGYKFRNENTDKADSFFWVNDNNPFINKTLQLDTSQYDWRRLQKGGHYSYNISGTNLNQIKSMISPGVPDDSIAAYRISSAGTYCNHKIVEDYLVVNYTLSISGFKGKNAKSSDVVGLSTKLLILNNVGRVIFDVSDKDLGIGEFAISDNKKYFTFFGVDYSTGKARSAYSVYDLLKKKLSKIYVVADTFDISRVLYQDNVFIYPLLRQGKSRIAQVLLFDAATEQLYHKDIGARWDLDWVSFRDGVIYLSKESAEDDSDQSGSLELKISDLEKVK